MACLNDEGKQLENQPNICEVANEPIDYTLKKTRRSYVMEDLGEVRHNMNIEKWIMDQVELKLCRNKEELFKDLREKDFAIQKLQDELENLRISKEQPQLKSSNLPKALKGALGVGKPCEIDTKLTEKTNSATLKRAIKIDDKSAVSATTTTVKTRTMTSTNTKLNSENVKVKGVGRGLYRSKTLRGESSTSKDNNRNLGSRPFKLPDDKKQLVTIKKVLAGSSQESQLDQCNSNSCKQAEGALAIDSEMAANLKRLTDEHSKLQAEYARVRTLLIEANTKCASGMTSPIPPEKDVTTDQTDQSKCLMINIDVEKQQQTNDDVEFSDGNREGFRKEVLRLKEELLASQHQCRILSDSKSQLEQDLNERENVLLQFSKQVEQMNAHHVGVIAEKEATIARLTQTINDLNERITEIEIEFNETKEFMQEENNSLTEALRDLEEKTWQNTSDMEKLLYQLQTKEKSCEVLSKMVDQAQSQLHELQSELNEKQDNAHNLIVTQGAELNDVSCAVKQLCELVINIRDRLLDDASTFGVDINGSPDRKTKARRSNEGRRLVQAILDAAKGEISSETSKNDSESSFSSNEKSPDVSRNHLNVGTGGSKHSSHVREVYSSVVTLGKMVENFTKFTITLLDEAEEEKKKLESESRMARIRSEEFQREVEENCRKRWSIEERNKDLTKELTETRTSLRDARESLRDMWTAVDEKASWLIENKKLREEIAMQRNEFSQLEAERNLLFDELRDLKCQMDSTHMNGNGEVSEIKNDPLFFKQQIVNMQQSILNKDEEYQDAKKKHERLMQTMNKNLQVAEKEVQKLDKIIDHVLQVLLNAHDLDLHPVLQQLWKDLDGPGYVATKFDETATIV